MSNPTPPINDDAALREAIDDALCKLPDGFVYNDEDYKIAVNKLVRAVIRERQAADREAAKVIAKAELQARANAYYEAADWCHEDPRYYKHFWERRQEVLSELHPDTEKETSRE